MKGCLHVATEALKSELVRKRTVPVSKCERERDFLPYLFRDLLFWAGVQSHHYRSPLGCGDGDHDHTCQNHDIHLK